VAGGADVGEIVSAAALTTMFGLIVTLWGVDGVLSVTRTLTG